jgi:hypothetical protein
VAPAHVERKEPMLAQEHTLHDRVRHVCGAIVRAVAALVCAACGAILPIEISQHADPGHAQIAVSAPAVELPADAHTHTEPEPGPVSEITAQAGGGTIVSAGAALNGQGTVTAGGAVPSTTVLNGTGTLRAG